MSLTRAQWEELWKDMEMLERAYDENAIPPHSGYRRAVRGIIKRTKDKIESVIGQMRTSPKEL